MIRTTILLAALTFGLGADALAQRERPTPAPRPSRELPEQLKRFDANGDGQLDDSERAAVRAWIDARRGERGERRGRRRGPEGRRPAGERRPPRPGRGERGGVRERLLERFDANGDGRLDAAERRAAREEVKRRRGRRGGDSPRPAPGGRRGPRR